MGWFPVEFHACVLQPPILTEHNTPSPERRAELRAEGQAAADHLFGSLDNQRVRCGTLEPNAGGLPVETTVTITPRSVVARSRVAPREQRGRITSSQSSAPRRRP